MTFFLFIFDLVLLEKKTLPSTRMLMTNKHFRLKTIQRFFYSNRMII